MFSLTKYEISQLADSLSTCVFKVGDCIFKQHDYADGMYFIEKGRVRIIQENENKSVEIRILGVGEFFGELSLVNKTKRTASAYVYNDKSEDKTCKLAFLNLEAFERLIGPTKEFIKYKILSY